MSLPKLMTISQFKYKYPVQFKEILTFPLTQGYMIPGMLSDNPDITDVEEWNGLLEALIEYIGRKYANCIFYIPVNESHIIETATEANATTMITALSINQKYRNLCATLANIDGQGKVENMSPSEWYLNNYKVAYTGTVITQDTGSASSQTGVKTTKTRQIGTLEKGTSGETTATLRDVAASIPYSSPSIANPVDTDTTEGSLDANNKTSAITSSNNTEGVTYDTLKKGYYNTGNKTTILKDLQELASKSPFFPKWLDEIMESIVIPVYTSTFGSRTERF